MTSKQEVDALLTVLLAILHTERAASGTVAESYVSTAALNKARVLCTALLNLG